MSIKLLHLDQTVDKYEIVDGMYIEGEVYKVKGLVEKTSKAETLKNVAILGRYIIILTIFKVLEKILVRKGREIHLTDVLIRFVELEVIYAYYFEATRIKR